MGTFYKRLKECRISMGLNQKDFGELAGVGATAQGNYESDDPERRREPDRMYFINLYHHGIDILYLMTGKMEKEGLTADESALLIAYRNASEAKKAVLLSVAKLD